VRELWSSAEQQQNYLLGLPKGADLMKTPVSEPSKHYFEMEIEGALDEEGTLEASLYVTAEGQSDAAIRRAYTRGYRTEWERQLTRELMKIHPDIVIHNMNFGSPYDYQEGPIRIMVQFIIPKYAFQTSEKLIYHPVSGKGAFNQAMAHLSQNITLEERKYPFRDRCSREVTLSEHIMLPAYKSINKIDDKVASDADNISYNGVVEADNGELNISQKAIYPKRVYEAAEWPAYRDAVAGQKKVSQTPVIINF
jgi:hypothetical protein